jgi:hypothetical protein
MTTEWKCHSYTQAEAKAREVSAEQGTPATLEQSLTSPDRGRRWVIDTT